jgi:hypothetical protein
MTCSRCGATNTPGAKFCPACGNALPPAPAGGLAAAAPAAGMPGYNIVSDHLPGTPAQEPLPPGVQKTTNGLAIASMVLGIVWVYWIGSILALIFGYIAKGQINESRGRQGGRGMAIAGIVLGWVGIGFLCLAIVGLRVSAGSR